MKNLTFHPIMFLRLLLEIIVAILLTQFFFNNVIGLKQVPYRDSTGLHFVPSSWGLPLQFRFYDVQQVGSGLDANQVFHNIYSSSYRLDLLALIIDLLVYLVIGVSIFWLLNRLPFLRSKGFNSVVKNGLQN